MKKRNENRNNCIKTFLFNRKDNTGAAMILTIVLIAVMMIFVFSLILVSYNLYASQSKNLSSRRNMEAANTFSIALENELTSSEASTYSNLWKYVRVNVAYTIVDNGDNADWYDWPYYDPEATDGLHTKENAIRNFNVDHNTEMEGFPADLSVGMYWTIPEGKTADEMKAAIESESISARKGILLYVETTAVTASQTYTVTDCYRLQIKENKDTEEKAIETIASNPTYNVFGLMMTSADKKEKWKWVHVERR